MIHQYAWVRWGESKSGIFPIRNGTRQGSIASPVLWAVYCDQLIQELRELGLGAYVAGVYMGVAAYADDLVLLAPSRHAMQKMLDLCEDYADRYNIMFSTDVNPQKSKSKCIYMVGKARNLVKPVPLRLCGKDLPWVESATHLGHELHSSGTMEHDAKIARAKYIDQTVEVRQSFSFASPVELVRALEVYTTSYYGSLLWDLQGDGAAQFCNSWSTAVKLAWNCPRATRTYLVQQVLGCGMTSARTEIMARYCKFFQGLRSSPSKEVCVLVNLVTRDIRSSTGKNVRLVSDNSGKDPWADTVGQVRAGLRENDAVEVEDEDKWRIQYLRSLLEQRQDWHYRGEEDQEEEVQRLVDSLCIN